MHNIGVGEDFFDLKWTFLNTPISKLKYIKNMPMANNLQKVLVPKNMVMCAILALTALLKIYAIFLQ